MTDAKHAGSRKPTGTVVTLPDGRPQSIITVHGKRKRLPPQQMMSDAKDGALLNDHVLVACEQHLRPMLNAYAEAEKQGHAALTAFNERMMAEAIACAARGEVEADQS